MAAHTRAQTIALHQFGMNVSKISKQLNVSRKYVMNAIERYNKYGEFKDLKRSGRPKKLSYRDERHLRRLVKGKNRLSTAKLKADLRPAPSKTDLRSSTVNLHEIFSVCWDCSEETMVKFSALSTVVYGRYQPNKAHLIYKNSLWNFTLYVCIFFCSKECEKLQRLAHSLF